MSQKNKVMQVRPERLSIWDVVHAVNLAITTFITYALKTAITPVCTKNLIRVDDAMESPKLAR